MKTNLHLHGKTIVNLRYTFNAQTDEYQVLNYKKVLKIRLGFRFFLGNGGDMKQIDI